MRFSIVVPVFNSAGYLDDCIASVLKQHFQDWELVLIDDGSSDGSADILDRYAKSDMRIRVWHEKNAGQFFARRKGILESHGEYLFFLDSDDELEPYALARVDDVLSHGCWDLILFHGRAFVDGMPTGNPIGRMEWRAGEVPLDAIRKAVISSDSLNSLCLKVFRRNLFSGDNTDYSCMRGIRHGEDKAMLLYPLSLARRCFYLPEELYRYRMNPLSVTRNVGLDSIRSLLGNERFLLTASAMDAWGMSDERSQRALGTYYLRTYIMVYFKLRKGCSSVDELQALRRFPWGSVLDHRYLKARYIVSLSLRDMMRYLAARLRI